MTPIYRFYYVAILFLAIGSISHLIIAQINSAPRDYPEWLNSSWFTLLAYYLPLAIGATIGLIVTWRYWSWLIREYHR
jgi:uncharacterized membrane protein